MAIDLTEQTSVTPNNPNNNESAELVALRERVATLEALVARLTQRLGAASEPIDLNGAEETRPADERLDATRRGGKRATGRRALLKTAGIAAAAALAAGAAVEASQHGVVARASGASPVYNSIDNSVVGTTSLTIASGNTANPIFATYANGAAGCIGIQGFASDNSTGVQGQANSTGGWGVYGSTDMGYGVVGSSASGIDLAAITSGRIFQQTASFTGAPTSGSYLTGEQIRDGAGNMYICIAGGSPGTWRKVAAGVPGVTGAINFLANPIRLLDTRTGSAWTAGSTHSVQITGVVVGGISVPSGAVGVIGNVTVVGPTSGGDLRLYPGSTPPATSTINFLTGQTIANGVTIGLSSSGKLNFKVDMASGAQTNVLFDASGYIL